MSQESNPEDLLFRRLTRTEYNRVKAEIDDLILGLVFDEISDEEYQKARSNCLNQHGWTSEEYRDYTGG